MDNYVFINVAVVGRYEGVLSDLCGKVVDSGLYDRSKNVYLVVNGDPAAMESGGLPRLFAGMDKFVGIHAGPTIDRCEFPTLQLIWDRCASEDITVCYLHTKGVTRQDTPRMRDWTEFLAYFNVERWRDRLSDLSSHDCSGVNLVGNPDDISFPPHTWGYGKAPLHYSGNFWWSKSSHIRRLPPPARWVPDGNYLRWRMMAEMWLCQLPSASYHCAWDSGVDHYASEYPRSMYERPL
jgi:hypothetical protein